MKGYNDYNYILMIFVLILSDFICVSSELKTLPFPHEDILHTEFIGEIPKIVTIDEYRKNKKCSYVAYDRPSKVAKCSMEYMEHTIVQRYVNRHSRVLELGARYGTTSCMIAYQMGNTGKLVSVEPDSSVWTSLEENIISHKCNMYVVKYPISNVDMTIKKKDSYGTIVQPLITQSDISNNHSLHYTYNDIQQIIGFTFNTLLIDCEGCIEYIFEHNTIKHLKQSLKTVRVIIIEGDQGKSQKCPKCTDYVKWCAIFKEIGFMMKVKVQDKVFKDIHHYVFTR